ncbi:hypothetical protein PROFUN_01327 [Planoprotostelium fungivorum]|uniref:Transcription initiation factor TFIID subunit 9 n=1 Tax=Planoprotostelium fungivorum TaxID=1890364 RepID=A0A2P6NZU3_9EUKA|nr:hypothetical protein PROFUN_01327 [Planoprotostelium fungivorum]
MEESTQSPEIVLRVQSILKSMGIEDYEPRVVNQLVELMHRYVSEVLRSSSVYSSHAGRTDIDLSDIKLAMVARNAKTFIQPTPRELMSQYAESRNKTQLQMPHKYGVVLPDSGACLLANNYQVEPRRKNKKEKNNNNNESNPADGDVAPMNTEDEGNEAKPKISFSLSNIAKKTFQ